MVKKTQVGIPVRFLIKLTLAIIVIMFTYPVIKKTITLFSDTAAIKGFNDFIQPIEKTCRKDQKAYGFDVSIVQGDAIYSVIQVDVPEDGLFYDHTTNGHSPTKLSSYSFKSQMEKCQGATCLCLVKFHNDEINSFAQHDELNPQGQDCFRAAEENTASNDWLGGIISGLGNEYVILQPEPNTASSFQIPNTLCQDPGECCSANFYNGFTPDLAIQIWGGVVGFIQGFLVGMICGSMATMGGSLIVSNFGFVCEALSGVPIVGGALVAACKFGIWMAGYQLAYQMCEGYYNDEFFLPVSWSFPFPQYLTACSSSVDSIKWDSTVSDPAESPLDSVFYSYQVTGEQTDQMDWMGSMMGNFLAKTMTPWQQWDIVNHGCGLNYGGVCLNYGCRSCPVCGFMLASSMVFSSPYAALVLSVLFPAVGAMICGVETADPVLDAGFDNCLARAEGVGYMLSYKRWSDKYSFGSRFLFGSSTPRNYRIETYDKDIYHMEDLDVVQCVRMDDLGCDKNTKVLLKRNEEYWTEFTYVNLGEIIGNTIGSMVGMSRGANAFGFGMGAKTWKFAKGLLTAYQGLINALQRFDKNTRCFVKKPLGPTAGGVIGDVLGTTMTFGLSDISSAISSLQDNQQEASTGLNLGCTIIHRGLDTITPEEYNSLKLEKERRYSSLLEKNCGSKEEIDNYISFVGLDSSLVAGSDFTLYNDMFSDCIDYYDALSLECRETYEGFFTAKNRLDSVGDAVLDPAYALGLPSERLFQIWWGNFDPYGSMSFSSDIASMSAQKVKKQLQGSYVSDPIRENELYSLAMGVYTECRSFINEEYLFGVSSVITPHLPTSPSVVEQRLTLTPGAPINCIEKVNEFNDAIKRIGSCRDSSGADYEGCDDYILIDLIGAPT